MRRILMRMPIKAWFPTFIYHEPLLRGRRATFNRQVAEECRKLRDFDREGRKWSALNYRGGYTSYASMNELHRFSSTFADLERAISRHVRRFASALDMNLEGREIFMTDFWVNIMPQNTGHGLHLHPLSFISGTYYVATPRNCPGIKFEDPRLSRLMAAPPKKADARDANKAFVTYAAKAGQLVLFESWLRHEVPQNRVAAERISVSFNYAWR